ncbi:hypothetical protein MPSEU_000252000 [Mayamaea pseudoterrestris]|nr:hypothetical protein MPSEU_000252000 [Mayamaea pseudoterrestris]
MWSYQVLSRRLFAHSFRGNRIRQSGILSVSPSNDHHRFLTTDDKNKDKRKTPEKHNFDKEFLQPAARGLLRGKHDSGIPRLAGRHKARLHPPPKRSGGRFTRILKNDDPGIRDDDYYDDILSDDMIARSTAATKTFSFDPRAGATIELDPSGMHDDYYAPELMDEDRYFWNEEDFEPLAGNDLNMEDLELKDGTFEIEYDDTDAPSYLVDSRVRKALLGDYDNDEEDDESVENDFGNEDGRFDRRRKPPSSSSDGPDSTDLEEHFFFGQNDIFEIAALDEKLFAEKAIGVPDMALPLKPHGPNLDDFLEAMMDHPTKYAQLMSEQLHPDSRREPKPFVPKWRLNPPLEFVEAHARFLFVEGLPPLEVNGEEGDLSIPVHRDTIQKTIARLFGVDSGRVFPCSTSSGYVGFSSPRELAGVLDSDIKETVWYAPATISIYNADEDINKSDFAKLSPQTTVEIRKIPPGYTAATLVQRLFPQGTEAGTVYGVGPEMVHFLSSTRALIRFESEEQAESAIVSQVLEEQLKSLGEYPIRMFRARRELVHAGFDGPYKLKEKRVMGPRLLVDGDMPSKKFYLSHARVISLRNLDPAVTKEEIAVAFQPYSARPRDVKGSVEFVKCANGLATGRAYVGFDIPWEAEASVKALNGLVSLGEKVANMRLVKDRHIPGLPFKRPEKRPDRSAEELLDDLNNWEKFVDPEDIKILVDAGISMAALDEALRGIRYSNASFGVFDASIRAESLKPEKMTGEIYKELVQMYVATMKECIATPENVGELYESVHFPNEPIDLSIFENETKRQESLQKRRS